MKNLIIYPIEISTDRPDDLLSAFSMFKNGKKLFKSESSEGSSNFLTCLSGLRTFAMMFILLGHCIGWTRPMPRINANIMSVEGEWFQSFANAFIAVHPIAVDSFFVIGGLLLTRSMLIQIEK